MDANHPGGIADTSEDRIHGLTLEQEERAKQPRGRRRSKAERNLAHGLGEVRRLASAFGLSDSVRDQACQLFRSAQEVTRRTPEVEIR